MLLKLTICSNQKSVIIIYKENKIENFFSLIKMFIQTIKEITQRSSLILH